MTDTISFSDLIFPRNPKEVNYQTVPIGTIVEVDSQPINAVYMDYRSPSRRPVGALSADRCWSIDACVFIDHEHVIFPYLGKSSLGQDRSLPLTLPELEHSDNCDLSHISQGCSFVCTCGSENQLTAVIDSALGTPLPDQTYRVFRFDEDLLYHKSRNMLQLDFNSYEWLSRNPTFNCSVVNGCGHIDKWWVPTDRTVKLVKE